jgi:hypothetical protein
MRVLLVLSLVALAIAACASPTAPRTCARGAAVTHVDTLLFPQFGTSHMIDTVFDGCVR